MQHEYRRDHAYQQLKVVSFTVVKLGYFVSQSLYVCKNPTKFIRIIIIQLIDEGLGDYHFYSAETSDILQGRRPSWISIGEAE